MQGTVFSYFSIQQEGFIQTDTEERLIFSINDWQSNSTPQVGDVVEFEILENSKAINIRLLASAGQQHTDTVNNNQQLNSVPPPLTDHQGLVNNIYQPPQANVTPNFADANEELYSIEEGYGFFDWVKKCLKNYANFSGRASRKEFWYFYLSTILFGFVAGVLDGILYFALDIKLSLFQTIVNLALIIPTVSVTTRRLHDIGKSGWWQLLWLLLIIGWIILIIWLATDTKPESNQWGAPARKL